MKEKIISFRLTDNEYQLLKSNTDISVHKFTRQIVKDRLQHLADSKESTRQNTRHNTKQKESTNKYNHLGIDLQHV